MLLWNDYEGKTIAEAFPLKKLLRPEGRSAFFTTTRPDGKVDIIRLTESADDQDELLTPWRQVTEAAQPNLVTIKRFGQTTFDGVPLTYALMEATDASLTEILLERPLTPTETAEVANAVTSALRTLHELQLTHGHIEPASIFACAETIKLRSDCVRECIPDPDFHPEAECQERRQQDIRALGVLLLRCLTLESQLNAAMRLPAPFHVIIPHALDGSWGLAEIADPLNPPAVKPLVPASVLEQHPQAAEAVLPVRAAVPQRQLDFDYADEAAKPGLPEWALNPKLWLIAAAGLLVLILAGHFLGKSTKPVATSAAAPIVDAATMNKPAVTVAPQPAASVVTPAGWHVVAFTYRREPQAFAKVAELQRRYPNLNPQVFSPTGRGPYFAALGGVMSREQAEAVLKQARRSGMPRDTFIRNYPAR